MECGSENDKKAGTVLVVDDEECLRRITDIALTQSGYFVLTAGSAEDAMETIKTHSGGIDLLLTDIRMPETDGMHLAAEFRKCHPGAGVVYMTAYSPADVERLLLNETVLAKPFCLNVLCSLVDRIVGAAG